MPLQWSPQHEGVSCQQFRLWQQQQQPQRWSSQRWSCQSIGTNPAGPGWEPGLRRIWFPVRTVVVLDVVDVPVTALVPRVSPLPVRLQLVSWRLSPLHVQPVPASVLRRLQPSLQSWFCESWSEPPPPGSSRCLETPFVSSGVQLLCRLWDQRAPCPPPQRLSVPPSGLDREPPPPAAAGRAQQGACVSTGHHANSDVMDTISSSALQSFSDLSGSS